MTGWTANGCPANAVVDGSVAITSLAGGLNAIVPVDTGKRVGVVVAAVAVVDRPAGVSVSPVPTLLVL